MVLKALLEARLPAKLAEADAAFDDGVTTPVPFEIHRSDVAAANGYPSLELIASGGRPLANSAAQVMRWRIAVGITVTGDNEEALAAHIERYTWAIRRIARDTMIEPDTAGIDSGEEAFSPVGQLDTSFDRPFVKAGYIELFVTTVE